ncbi:MAG: sigma-70 family RNA polymerase sigma factor [Anaerolineaceae bacterium]|nr:sigma-70 family RNA polymerase sigma factor [Anaerolineaceae bacterium]
MMTLEPDTIAVLITRCLHGDQAGFSTLYDHFAPMIYRLCYSLLGNPQDAEDVLQESFVYAFKNISRFDARRASFKTWLYTIALSRCRNMYRRKHFSLVELGQLLTLNLSAPSAETPEASLAQQNLQEVVENAVLSLSPPLREAVILRYGHGLTYREIAAVMDCPQKTAESRVRLAHDRLRGLLQPVAPGLLDELVGL